MAGAAQIVESIAVESLFFGAQGDDPAGNEIKRFVDRTPVRADFRITRGVPSASTVVLADPEAQQGKGERTFINTIGAAGHISNQDIPESFYTADMILLAGTALVPGLHDALGEILSRAKAGGAFTVVGTVYDFRNQKADPQAPWPLGGEEAFQDIDLLVKSEGIANPARYSR